MDIYVSNVEYNIFGNVYEIPSIQAFPAIVDDNYFMEFISKYNPTFKIENDFYVHIGVIAENVNSCMEEYGWTESDEENFYFRRIIPSIDEIITSATIKASKNSNNSSTDDEKVKEKIYPEYEDFER